MAHPRTGARHDVDACGRGRPGRGGQAIVGSTGTDRRTTATRWPGGHSVAGLLLTGGASRRMGRDKATIVLADGRTCAQTVGARLAEVVDPVLEVGPGTSGLAAVPDDRPGAGPLAALATGWSALVGAGHDGPVVVLACDLPGIRVPLLELLALAPGIGTVVPVVDGHPQPLCARFGAASLDQCARLVEAGQRSLRSLLGATPVTWLGPEQWSTVVDERCFADIDTPGDLARLAAQPVDGLEAGP